MYPQKMMNSTNKSKIEQTSKLSANQSKFLEKLPHIFKLNMIDSLKYELDFFSKRNELFDVVKSNNFAVFMLFLESRSSQNVTELLTHLTHEQRINILTDNDYQQMRLFIEKYSDTVENLETVISPLVDAIKAIEPHLKVEEIMLGQLQRLTAKPLLKI